MQLIASPKVTQSGLYVMETNEYYRDPCPSRSLSSGVLHTLLTKTPMHADAAYRASTSSAMDMGSAVHKLLLEKGSDITVIDAEDWRKKDTKEQRDAARAIGRIPLLAKDYHKAQSIADPLRHAIELFTGVPMADCLREIVCAWEEGGKWRRAMIDILTPDGLTLIDAKTTARSVIPRECERTIYNSYMHQRSFYLRGMNAIDPDNAAKREFYFLFGETVPPFAVSPPIRLSEAGAQMADEQVQFGCERWDTCLETGIWPGYSAEPFIASPPVWILQQWHEGVIAARDTEDTITEGDGTDD